MSSNSLTLQVINERLNKRAPKLKPPPPKPKPKPWWVILVNVLLGIVSIVAEVVATALLGPVGGMIVGVAADVTTSIISDVISNQNPFAPENLIFNVVLPVAAAGTKAFTASKIAKNSVFKIANATKSQKIQNLSQKLQSIELDDLADGTRKYEKIIKECGFTKKELREFKFNDAKTIKFLQQANDAKYEKLIKVNNTLRKTQRFLSYIDDPNFAQKTLLKWIGKVTKIDKVFKPINKGLLKLTKKINTKFFKKTKQKLSKVLIPFTNHTVAPWIIGIKLFPIKGAMNYYHVSIFFEKSLTNNKQPVSLYNKSWKFIYAWLTAPSCGKFYIDKIAWGWDVGAMIRNNHLLASQWVVKFFKSQYHQTFYLSMKVITKAASIINKLVNNRDEMVQQFYKDWSPQNIVSNTTYTLSGNLKVGKSFVRKTTKTFQTGQIRYMVKYAKNKTNNIMQTKVKNQIINFKNNKKEIGYGKYKYKLS